MDLHPVDDLPFHQAPTPFNVASTSEVHFNDGYWFATYTDDVYLTVGLRVHPNMNVMDGFAGVTTDGTQRTTRFSRPLRPQCDSLQLGLRLEVREPTQRLGLSLTEYDVDPRRPGGGPPRFPEAKRVGPTEFPVRLTGPGGAVGMAHFEHYILGQYRRYGFDQSA